MDRLIKFKVQRNAKLSILDFQTITNASVNLIYNGVMLIIEHNTCILCAMCNADFVVS